MYDVSLWDCCVVRVWWDSKLAVRKKKEANPVLFVFCYLPGKGKGKEKRTWACPSRVLADVTTSRWSSARTGLQNLRCAADSHKQNFLLDKAMAQIWESSVTIWVMTRVPPKAKKKTVKGRITQIWSVRLRKLKRDEKENLHSVAVDKTHSTS